MTIQLATPGGAGTDVVLTCSRCQDWIDLPPSRDLADYLRHAEAVGWLIGDGQALCPVCLIRRACEATGHRWGRWTTLGPSLGGRWLASRARHCRVCTAGEFQGVDTWPARGCRLGAHATQADRHAV